MMEVLARYDGAARFVAESRGHQIISDQPLDNGGADAGMTPPEFLLAALATCAGYYAAQYLLARKLPTDGLAVKVVAGKSLQPARLSSFQIEVTAPGLDERHQQGVLRAAKSCLVHNTMLAAPTIELTVNTAPPVAV